MPIPLLLDTDIGDDVIALLLAALCPEVSLNAPAYIEHQLTVMGA